MGNVEYVAPPLPYASFLRNITGEENASGWPLNSTSLALENARLVKSGAGTLYGFSGFSNKNVAQFVLCFDLSTLPASGAVPVFVMTVPTVSNFAVWFGDTGRFFQQGIALANSSTAATLTAGLADCWFDAQYV